MKGKATLKHISKSLNLSISTVSRALKNHPDISENTKKKVVDLAALLEYEPNTHAISLRTNRSRLFGIIVPEISYYFYDSFIAEIEKESRRIGYSLIILQSGDDPGIEMENLKLCRLNRVEGIFVSITPSTRHIQPFLQLMDQGIPVIFFDKVPEYEACNKICLSDASAARMAAEKIIECRKQNILALFGNSDLLITQKRLAAFQNTFTTLATHIPLTIAHALSPAEAANITRKVFSEGNRPDTVFCMSDEILTGVMKALQQLKLKIPEQVAVVSISNDGFIPHLYEPDITYVETSGQDLARLAFKRMTDHMSGKTFVQELTIPSRLAMGGSI